jgi:hypothetical protein
MTHRFGILCRFRFNLPQRIAAGLLALFLLQGLWLAAHRAVHASALPRLTFLAVGCLLGGSLWWVARRLYGNLGGYTTLTLYCFSPTALGACARSDVELLAALGVYGGVYTAIGVAHAMQGPRARWQPRIVLLMAAFALAAATQMAALPVVALLGMALMLWVAEGRRGQVLPVLLMAVAGALVVVWVRCGFSLDAFGELLRPTAGFPRISVDPARQFFSSPANAGLTLAVVAALAFYLFVRRSRYFGNSVPLTCASILVVLTVTGVSAGSGLWALPFLLTFVGGVFADAYEGPRGGLALGTAGAIVLLQAVVCLMSLPGLL